MASFGTLKLRKITWSELFYDTLELAKKIAFAGFHPELLVVVARGGLVVGRLLSDFLSIRRIANVSVRLYEGIGTAAKEPILEGSINSDEIRGKPVLVVDDIVDSGTTLSFVLKYISAHNPGEVRSAALYVKPWAKTRPDFFVRVIEEWAVFPYEIRETLESIPNEYQSLLGLDSKVIEDIKNIVENSKR